jgi:hypothetical protein
MSQQDYFNTNSDTSEEKPKESIDEQFERERKEWGEKIANMNKLMKGIGPVSELMLEVYTERQICLDYHHYLISKLISINRKYRLKYDERWNYWSFISQIKYPNNAALGNKIQSELGDIVEIRELLDNHIKFMEKTTGTIDNLIYAIPKRIEIEQITRGK